MANNPFLLSLRRRSLLRGAALGASALAVPAAATGLLAGCERPAEPGGAGAVTVGSNYSDEVPKKALAEVLAHSGLDSKVNTIDHNTFQENITRYLQATPDDVFTWFAGLPYAVLRRARVRHRHLGRVGRHRRQLLWRLQAGVHRRRRQAVLRAVLPLPVGGLLPQECVSI